jgi:light-regulated signal transduction histidine kinase (bacteriophytochrome)
MISSFLQLLQRRYEGQLDSDADEFIGYAVDGAQRMHDLINDLLEFSRVTTKGKKFEDVNMEEPLENALTNLKLSIEENNVAIVPKNSLPTINGDYSQMTQLFQNIIGNAIKYRSSDPPQIHISVTNEANNWLFSIKDNGLGIDPKYADNVFKIFRRLHSNSEYEGTGVGLAITKRIVERHNGQIWVESEPGNGSTFYFTLPK